MPRLVTKQVADVIATLSDSGRFLASTTYEVKDLGALMDIWVGDNRSLPIQSNLRLAATQQRVAIIRA